MRVVCFAETISEELLAEGVTFVSWSHILQFVHERFAKNTRLKADHDAWDNFGQYLWNRVITGKVESAEEFFTGWEVSSRSA